MKEALKLALEALEEYDAGLLNDYGGGNVEWWQDYIRAELGRAYEHYQSQTTAPVPEQPEQPEQEPVAWEQFYPDIGKPQLGQEPVAIYRAGQAKGEGFHVEFLKEMGDDEVLFYTTPPKRPWVGLTDEEVMDIAFNFDVPSLVVRTVEAKLKEKNT